MVGQAANTRNTLNTALSVTGDGVVAQEEQESQKPLLRGYLHAGAAVAALVATVALAILSAGDRPKQISLLVYGASSILLFGWSAFYHLGHWSPRVRAAFRRVDHANIFVLIAGTYTPMAFNLLTGWPRILLLATIWGLAALGMAAAAPALRIPRQVLAGLYVAMGWVAVAFIPQIVAAVGVGAVLLLALGGMLYTVGALAYAFRWPNIWPRVFGYHEVFHLATILAAGAFFVFMLTQVLPFVRR
ncbi:MAG: hemolysin III family protein [Ktedonobacterales bacterium]